MTNYRPVCDVWILARSKVKYYGAYPSGFLERARALLGVSQSDPVLHVCSGMVRSYPFRGVGDNDRTLDVRSELAPDFLVDVTKEQVPSNLDGKRWAAILTDPPYTSADAEKYGDASCPDPNDLLRNCLSAVRVGGRVGMLHYIWPRPPKWARLVAAVGVLVGYSNRIRIYSVFEREEGK